MADGSKPSREFYTMMIVMLRRAKIETNGNLLDWFDKFGERDNDPLRLKISKEFKEAYPDDPPPLNPADYIDEDEELDADQPTEEEIAFTDNPEQLDAIETDIKAKNPDAEFIDDEDEDLPNVARLDNGGI